MADALTVLREARALLADPDRWTQHVFARDAHGEPTDPEGRHACCWCLRGAVASRLLRCRATSNLDARPGFYGAGRPL